MDTICRHRSADNDRRGMDIKKKETKFKIDQGWKKEIGKEEEVRCETEKKL